VQKGQYEFLYREEKKGKIILFSLHSKRKTSGSAVEKGKKQCFV
jgi:hypothetical protein